jgi:hypothetical protein
MVRALVEAVLRARGADDESARDGEAARELARTHPRLLEYCLRPEPPDLALLHKLLLLAEAGGARRSPEAGLAIFNACVPPERRMGLAEALAGAAAALRENPPA